MTTSPHGSWPSPVTPASLAAAGIRLSEPEIVGDDTWWLERRATGRTTLVRRSAGRTQDVTSPGVDVRSRVHEYGGASWTPVPGGVVVSDAGDDRLLRIDLRPDGTFADPVPLTPPGARYGDLTVDAGRGRVLAVREDHGGGWRTDPTNTLVAVPLDGSAADAGAGVVTLVAGPDFVTWPRLSPAGDRLAWVEWDDPAMPWDASRVMVGDLDASGAVIARTRIAGEDGVSATEPTWTDTGDLLHVDDRSGWWNLFRTEFAPRPRTRPLHPAEAEFSLPAWGLGPGTLAVLDEDTAVCAWSADGRRRLGAVHLPNGVLEPWGGDWEPSGAVRAGHGRVVLLADHPRRPRALIQVDRDRGTTILAESGPAPAVAVSEAEPVSWQDEAGDAVHGFFFPPRSDVAKPPADELPPLIVQVHGGPTAAASPGYDPAVQFWTSRGLAVLALDHRGGTGRGRAYREALAGRWGVLEVADAVSGALALAERGLVDHARLVIRGGSAGGFTTLAAMTTSDVFAAGISRYGIGDLEALAADTHKFEARYLDGLLGPYPAAAAVYRERSPLHHADRLRSPVLLLQGEDDAVVPLGQSRDFAAAARAQGVRADLVVFPGEGHGFRLAATIEAAAEAELAFLGEVLGFTPAPR